ncbi:MAG: 2-dehydro-3-deoxy-6-phosphogalactonate aldolase [Rudaea sp.]|uniref:2-dehydro-3-deoxy-6-phosphogalactonate aldolase n=1 Tax=Rudaea sp. TaxID=2136325 RepID=UPI0039E34F2F
MNWQDPLPLIAILRGVTPGEIEEQVDALIDAGIALIEIPTNSPDWLRSVERAQKHANGRAIVGAGTVLTAADADALAATGATLMVTPNTDPPLIRRAVAAGLTVAAGFMTPSEAFAALAAGAQILKLFPSSNLGAGYVRAIKAVLPKTVPLFAVGGVTPDNLPDFLGAGCSGAGLGGDLYKPGQLSTATYARAEAFVQSHKKYTS